MIPVVWAALIIVTLALQSALLPVFAFNGIKPDLLLIITVSAGLLYGKEHGVGVGFFAGLVQDLAAGGIFGLNTLTKILIGLLAGSAERKVFKEHILLPLTAMAVTTVLSYGAILVLLMLFGYKVNFVAAAVNNLPPQMLYNMIFSVPLHWVVYRLGRWRHH
ncbi:MAG: rod shape-determining protein MreD [Negativicutes bacterium]|nr:rod shape-determining protein MreD [Negativicutes bacterium]